MPIEVNTKKWGPEYVQGVAPVNPSNDQTWFNTNEKCGKVYSEDSTSWIRFTSYVGSHYGYDVAGFDNTNNYSSLLRMAFPFDSGAMSVAGNLNVEVRNSAAFNSTKYGFVAGGYSSGHISSTERLQFPFDSGTAYNIGNLSKSLYNMAGCNCSIHGFFAGGCTDTPTYHSSIERITFSQDSGPTLLSHTLNSYMSAPSCCNSSRYGFWMASYNGSSYRYEINRMTFPFDSSSSIFTCGVVAHHANYCAGFNSSFFGYCCGGNSPPVSFSTICRLNFPLGAGLAATVGNLSQTINNMSSINSTLAGYTMGGLSSILFSVINKIYFPFDSGTSGCIGNLSVSKSCAPGLDGTDFSSIFGYYN